jgi:AcrR family transcriptional regulator
MRESTVKDRILDTASRLFYDQGYHITGINQIIEEADIARASLYNHFPSKTDLLLAYLDRTHIEWFVALDNYLAPFATAKEKLIALFDFRIGRQKRLRYKGCHFNKITAETSTDEEVFKRVKIHKERLRQYILTLVKDAGHRGVLEDEVLAETLFLLMEGGIVLGAMFRSSEDAEKAKQIAASLL